MIKWLIHVSFVVATILVVNDVASLGDPVQFIDLTSLLIVVVPTLFATGVGYQKSRTTALSCALFTAIVSSILGVVIGVIQTLGNAYSDSEAVFVGLSVALLPLFYGLIITLLVLPFHLSCKK
ncbi:MotA/TolQ/ExbB proton channel family protein [Vibrio sp. Of14-4]|uniref:MotA/TolQ/ExbB proton channel family protein n=1 Tax=Vibrio sp. Of14-4 TaxID=2724878 RepID=UPI001EF18F8C|nr:MotA/TolQ/ExbB proton channel family protein [Vibrio sp. Of14-4]MCG7490191.1 MotA/TolQ/ExbB proton channel family protein [Vibrio sp. Of14-4]